MRIVLLFRLALSFALLTPAVAFAAQKGRPVTVPNHGQVDTLLKDLKRQRNERAAERIAARIQNRWAESGSASVDLMMGWAQKAMNERKFDVALDFLDQVVVLKPDYAEGWNRRATAHYLMNNFKMSMSDLDRTLQLEPRHFGALSGLARIMSENGDKELALQAWEKVLTIYPMMRSAQQEVSDITEDLTGSAI
ncbi:hypothetical protein QBK99_16680 [Corticibacterium sp. UT-5YL-CI-8]|nr:hypothetical protein [Tianweitania sp. UT-5YL-CI-8]